jgi:phage-related holin
VFQKGYYLFDVFTFSFILIFITLIYIPFLLRSIKAYRSVDNPTYKKGFISLSFMALCFILVFICFLIDRTLILLGSFGFTLFYFMGWAFVVLGFLGAYLGYIRPKSKEE